MSVIWTAALIPLLLGGHAHTALRPSRWDLPPRQTTPHAPVTSSVYDRDVTGVWPGGWWQERSAGRAVRPYPHWHPAEAWRGRGLNDAAAAPMGLPDPLVLRNRLGQLQPPAPWRQVTELRSPYALPQVGHGAAPLGRLTPPGYSAQNTAPFSVPPEFDHRAGIFAAQVPPYYPPRGQQWQSGVPPVQQHIPPRPQTMGQVYGTAPGFTAPLRSLSYPLSSEAHPSSAALQNLIRSPAVHPQPAEYSQRSELLATLRRPLYPPQPALAVPLVAPVRPIQARRSGLRQDSEETPERFSSLPEHFQDPEDVPQPQAMLALVSPPVPLPQRPAQVPLVTSQLPQYSPYEVPQQYQQFPTAGFYPYALQTPSAQQPALSTGDPAAQTVLPSGRTPSRSSEFISPVRFTTQLRRSEAQRAAPLTELRNADLWRQSGDQTRGSHGTNTPPAAPGRSPTTANSSSASGRPRHPPEPIKRGDLSKVSSGLVLTATEGLTLPLSAAAAILDKFGSAMAVPFPGMGAAIARAAGVLGGAAQSATRLAPTMAPLLVDTLEEVWKQAARAESQSATATGRWEDFNNGINVFEVTAHGDGVPVRTGENEQDTQRGESVQDETKERVSVNTSRRGPGDEVKVVNERTENVAVEQATPTPESTRKNAKDEKEQEEDEAKEQEDEEPTDPSDAQLLVEVEDDDPETTVWQNMDWAQFLLNRRQVQAAQGISARSLDLTE